MAQVSKGSQTCRVQLLVSVEELRVLVHRLTPEGTFLRHRSEGLLPDGHEELASDLAEQLRRFHDRDLDYTEKGEAGRADS